MVILTSSKLVYRTTIEFHPHREHVARHKHPRTNAVYCSSRDALSCQNAQYFASTTHHLNCGIPVKNDKHDDKHNQRRHTHQASKLTLPPHTRHSVRLFWGLQMLDVLHSLLLFPWAYSKLQEAKCFLWPTAELHFALQAPRPSLTASSVSVCSCRPLSQISTTPRPAIPKFAPGLQSLKGVLRNQAYLQVGDDHFHV